MLFFEWVTLPLNPDLNTCLGVQNILCLPLSHLSLSHRSLLSFHILSSVELLSSLRFRGSRLKPTKRLVVAFSFPQRVSFTASHDMSTHTYLHYTCSWIQGYDSYVKARYTRLVHSVLRIKLAMLDVVL